MAETIYEFCVDNCPVCNNAHSYKFTVRTLPLFAGSPSDKEQMQSFEIIVPCLTEGNEYKLTISVPRPPHYKIISVRRREQ